MLRVQRLDDRLARRLSPAGASDHLRQQLKRALRRAKVGKPEADVRRDDADERDRRKIVALGDHLRADEDVDLAPRDTPQDAGDRAAAPDGVAIDARDTRPRKPLAEVGLEPLGAEAGLLEVLAAARPALPRHRRRVVAVVAPDTALRAVIGQRHAAVRALERRAALAAEDRVANPRRFSSTSDCSPRLRRSSIACDERLAKRHVGPARGVLRAHVHDVHGGQRPVEHAFVSRIRS